jgi:hypothetical protein
MVNVRNHIYHLNAEKLFKQFKGAALVAPGGAQ